MVDVWVFGHNEEGILSNPVGHLQYLAAHAPRWPWRHTYSRGPPDGGIKFVVGYDKQLWGEFTVKRKTKNNKNPDGWPWYYFPERCSVYQYVPQMNYVHLVNQLHIPAQASPGNYQKFIGKLSGVKSLCGAQGPPAGSPADVIMLSD